VNIGSIWGTKTIRMILNKCFNRRWHARQSQGTMCIMESAKSRKVAQEWSLLATTWDTSPRLERTRMD
jgi:hypothetical protein